MEQRFPTSGIVCETLRDTQIVGLSSLKLFLCLGNNSWSHVCYLAENYIWCVRLSVPKNIEGARKIEEEIN